MGRPAFRREGGGRARGFRSAQTIRAMTQPGRAQEPGDDRRRDRDRRRRADFVERVGDRRRNRLSRSPGWRPKTTTSAPSGTRVRISTGVMSVRWSPSAGEEVGHLAEDDPAVHAQQVAGRQDHHERRDAAAAGLDFERPDAARGTRRRTRTARADRPRRTRRTRRARRRPASARRGRPSWRSCGRGSARR